MIFFWNKISIYDYVLHEYYVSDLSRQRNEIMQKVCLFLFLLSPVLALVVFCNRRSPTTLSKAATVLALVFGWVHLFLPTAYAL